MPHDLPLTLADIYRARHAIAGTARRTPLVGGDATSHRLGREVRLKLELAQETGSFKVRGAVNRLAMLGAHERGTGVIACSTGNHARGLAAAGQRLGVRVVVCMSQRVPNNKVHAVHALGAEVRIVGQSQDEAEAEAKRIAEREGLVYVSPYDDPGVVAGQGTIGLELIEDWPELEMAVVPLSGGGLVGGIALALKSANPQIRVVGVSMERGAAMIESQRAGRPVEVVEEDSLADSLAGGIGLDNRCTFALVRDLVDDLVTVSEAEIADAMRWCYFEERLVVEGGGSVGMAALLAGRVQGLPDRIAAVVSGRNIDMQAFTRIITGTG